jgi:hypothetical protein
LEEAEIVSAGPGIDLTFAPLKIYLFFRPYAAKWRRKS